MEEKIDEKLYSNYLKGKKEAFEILYNKYKNKLEYFVFNIVKNYQVAEDISQDTFIYVMQNKKEEKYDFKYYIYLVAKSKAYNYIKLENRRNEIVKIYLSEDEKIEKDILEIISKEETKKELLEALELLDLKYRNAVYLVNIEGFSYEETSKILGETLQNTKTLIHRGKKQLRKILINKGFSEMNKISKVLIIVICLSIMVSGVGYAATFLYKKFNTNHNIKMNPSFQSTLDENTANNLWIGTLDLAWKDLQEKIGVSKIEFEENIETANKLNESNFSKEMLNPNDYQINVERTWTDGYKIDAKLNKELNFLEPFDNFSNHYTRKFGYGEEKIKWFGINNATLESVNKNVEVLFYDTISKNNLKSENFAVKLKTKEDDEIILYRTDDEKSFNEYYNDILKKSSKYTGRKEFGEDDEIMIPYIRINGIICYNELYGKEIKNSDGLYMYDVSQDVNFSLNEKGCNLSSKSSIVTEYNSGGDKMFCYFYDKFVLFMKEANSDKPYFALKVDNDDILEKVEETDEPKLIDYTLMKDKDYYNSKVEPGEYKFFEDENFKYYYPTQKTKYVVVYFKDGETATVEEALVEGKITIDLLDKYEYEYIKKKK